MIVGVLVLDLTIAGSRSLKDKRQVVRSLLDTIKNKHNVSAAELDSLDSWRTAVVGVACISNDRDVANTVLNHVLARVESDPRLTVQGCSLEFL